MVLYHSTLSVRVIKKEDRAYNTESVYKVVLQKLIPAQIRQFIRYYY